MLCLKLFLHLYDNRKKPTWYQIIGDEVKNVWNPDLIFLHVTNIKTLTKYGSEEKFTYWLNTEKNIMQYWESILVTFSCSFNFKNYPFDENSCSFDFGCLTMDIESELQFNPIKILKKDGKISSFSLHNFTNDIELPFDMWIKSKVSFIIILSTKI